MENYFSLRKDLLNGDSQTLEVLASRLEKLVNDFSGNIKPEINQLKETGIREYVLKNRCQVSREIRDFSIHRISVG